MYLKKKTYIGNQYREPKEQVKVTLPKKQDNVLFKVRDKIQQNRISEITEDVAYWRKANQIHKWFVDNVQDGEDDCGEYYVSKEHLEELIDTCKRVVKTAILEDGQLSSGYSIENGVQKHHYVDGKVIVNAEEVAEILPNQEGFFFGGTDYNELYLDSVKNTIEMLEPLLKEQGGDFYYTSSW